MAARDIVDAHPAADSERSQVIITLCRAFFDDRIYRWMVPDDGQRRRSADLFYTRFVGACWPHGAVYAGGAGAGAALWVPPGAELVDEHEADEFTRELLETAGDDDCQARTAQVFAMLDEYHPADPHWYLAFMGVDPSAQGHGVGTSLLAAVLTRADRDGMPAYLEASCPENRRLYERHGFELMRELTVSDSPAIYAMWRTATGGPSRR